MLCGLLADWKYNNSDHTYSCPRDWRLSALRGPIEGPPETSWTITVLFRFEGFKGALSWSPILPRDISLSHNQSLGQPMYKFFQFDDNECAL